MFSHTRGASTSLKKRVLILIVVKQGNMAQNNIHVIILLKGRSPIIKSDIKHVIVLLTCVHNFLIYK